MTAPQSSELKSQLQFFGLNPQDWVLKGPYPHPLRSKATWQGLFINKEEPQFQFFALWRPNGLLELRALG